LPPINLEIRRRELWGVFGRNGAGKTTLVRTLLGLQKPLGGAVLRPSGVAIGYVPQRHTLDRLVPMRAVDLILEGTERGYSCLLPVYGREAHERARRAIEATGTEALLERRYRDLSEGQKQRVLVARAVAGAPDLLILDEPTSAMDIVAEDEMVALLRQLIDRSSIGVVLVSHRLADAGEAVDRLLFLEPEADVALAGPVGEVVAHPAFVKRYGAVLERKARSTRPPSFSTEASP
jgi:zinc transport system ATP-binding protein